MQPALADFCLHWSVVDDHLGNGEAQADNLAITEMLKSNQVSARSLPETGISAESGGDFRRLNLPKRSIGKVENNGELAKARHWRPFLALRGRYARNPDCLAGDAVLIAPVSR